jgi:replication-associated recombination protein RarA
MKELGYGRDYHYAHDDYSIKQENLPENLRDRSYYNPGENDEPPHR